MDSYIKKSECFLIYTFSIIKIFSTFFRLVLNIFEQKQKKLFIKIESESESESEEKKFHSEMIAKLPKSLSIHESIPFELYQNAITPNNTLYTIS